MRGLYRRERSSRRNRRAVTTVFTLVTLWPKPLDFCPRVGKETATGEATNRSFIGGGFVPQALPAKGSKSRGFILGVSAANGKRKTYTIMKFNKKKYLTQVLCILGGLLAAFVLATVINAESSEKASILSIGVLVGCLLAILLQAFPIKRRHQDDSQSKSKE